MRPALLICDADALFQAFLHTNIAPLQIVKSEFGIQPVVTPEVELELGSNRRLSPRIAPQLKKAISTSVLKVLDSSVIQDVTGCAQATASATFAAIQTLGNQYQKYVDFGEAYTHATALTLGVPAMSHDITALKALQVAGLALPSPVVRYLDLVVLGYQSGKMPEADCDTIRQTLASEKEFLPKCFTNQSFKSGVAHFHARLVDSRKPRIGLASSPVPSAFATTILL